MKGQVSSLYLNTIPNFLCGLLPCWSLIVHFVVLFISHTAYKVAHRNGKFKRLREQEQLYFGLFCNFLNKKGSLPLPDLLAVQVQSRAHL